MEKDIAEGKIGSVGSYDVDFKEGKLIAKAGLKAPEGLANAGMFLEIPGGPVIDKLFSMAEKAIPGTMDDVVLESVKSFLKKALGL